MIRERAGVTLIVLSLVAGVISMALVVWVILVRLHARAAAEEPPALTVEAVYPGATASGGFTVSAFSRCQPFHGVSLCFWFSTVLV